MALSAPPAPRPANPRQDATVLADRHWEFAAYADEWLAFFRRTSVVEAAHQRVRAQHIAALELLREAQRAEQLWLEYEHCRRLGRPGKRPLADAA